jgi:hypothetical protein
MGYWIINTAGIGAIIVGIIGTSVFAAYVLLLRWVVTAPSDSLQEEVTKAGDEET